VVTLAGVHLHLVIGLILAAISTTLTNVAYSREHDAAAALPTLSLRRPLQSLQLLVSDRSWLFGFAMESGGFASYAAALALAPLAVVQSIGAGGIGVLAYVTARVSRRRLGRLQLVGVWLSALGLVLLGVSLLQSSDGGGRGSTPAILAWLGGTAGLALVVLYVGRKRGGMGVALGVAGGLLFSIGDFSTKLATQGGTHFAFLVTLAIGYTAGTSLLQLGYQRGSALTVAGLATLATNALPILAGTIVLGEPVPSGGLGAARVLAFVAVVAGAVLLAVRDPSMPVAHVQAHGVAVEPGASTVGER
jgi:drug/metabolite transporter (DMT)-like permease